MSADPVLSVVLPVHDGDAFLRIALESVLGQTFTDFEVIVVDDCSTDGSVDIVREFERQDARVHVVVLGEQVGVASALNAGIARASAPLVARMDADDVARPERFAVQVAQMHRDPSLGLVGAQIEVIGYDGAPEGMPPWVLPTTHDETVWRLLYGTPICHPTVMMRTAIVRALGGYDPSFVNEDMELWTRMAFVTRLCSVDEVLLEYRMPAAVHQVKLAAWQPHITRVTLHYLEKILDVPVAEAVVRALRGIPTDHVSDDLDVAVTDFEAASLLAHAFHRMRDVGVLCGDGLQTVSELMEAHVQELTARAHVRMAVRV